MKFHFKKKYGQNFLKDRGIVKKIVEVAQIKEGSLVIEVGPGKAILTQELCQYSDQVLCYEIDLELKKYLIDNSNLNHVDFIFDDFLTRNLEEDISKYSYSHLYFVSNVPYYITTPILMKLIQSSCSFEKIVMMVQEEVGERFCATPNSKSYGSVTVFLSYFFQVKREFKVGREQFIPRPNVDSEVISLTMKRELIPLQNKEHFFQLVKDSFQFKRKNIKNNLLHYDLPLVSKVLEDHHLSLLSRAEQIPMEVFVELSNRLCQNLNHE